MPIHKKTAFSRRLPDLVTEELASVLSSRSSFEFKELFDVVHENLRARNAASGGEEMLRLRAYEKLQNLVARGMVKKDGKKYKGHSEAAGHTRNHSTASDGADSSSRLVASTSRGPKISRERVFAHPLAGGRSRSALPRPHSSSVCFSAKPARATLRRTPRMNAGCRPKARRNRVSA